METAHAEVKKELNIRLLVVLIAAVVLLYPLLTKVHGVEKSISSIGTVTLDSEEAILQAEQAYSALTETQKGKVDNYDVLLAARFTYECLVVEDAIDRIGKVGMESEEAIAGAEELYDALTEAQKSSVNNYRTLTDARKNHTLMVSAVQKAAEAIDAIGTVTIDSGEKIGTAREAYDALEALEKKLDANLLSYVSDKVGILTSAEETYDECVAETVFASAKAMYDGKQYTEALAAFLELADAYPDTSKASQARDLAAQSSLKLAESAYTRGDQYTAMKLLKEMEEEYSQTEEYLTLLNKITAKLTGNRPSNGAKFSDKIAWGWCELRVTAASYDMCVKVVSTENKDNCTMFFIRSGETASVKLANGTYDVYFTYGEYWFDKTVGFGDDASYGGITGRLSLNSWISGNMVYYYRYDLDLKNTGNSDLTTDSATAEDFWG